MQGIQVKSFDTPDETRPFEGKGMAQLVQLAGKPVSRGTFEPGWRWSDNVKPIAGTDTCQISHVGYVMQGSMRIHMDDGTEELLTPGEGGKWGTAVSVRGDEWPTPDPTAYVLAADENEAQQ